MIKPTVSTRVISNNLPMVERASVEGAYKVVEKVAHRIKNIASYHAPVDTGALRESVVDEDGGSSGDVILFTVSDGPGVKGRSYGVFQELGTGPQGYSQPFLIPACLTVTYDLDVNEFRQLYEPLFAPLVVP